MKWLTRWFLDNPVAANLLMVLILAGGLLSLQTLRVESFPQIPPTQLSVSVVYPGGTAKQVDEGITQRVEDALSGVPGVQRISSTSQRGLAVVTVRKTTDADMDRLIEDVRNRVNNIVGLPAQAEQPRVARDEFTNLASFVMVAGDLDEGVLQQVANRVEKALKKHPDISQVTNTGKREPLLLVEPMPEELKRYSLGMDQLVEAIREWSLEYRSGQLKTAQGNLVLRGDGYADNLVELESLPVVTTSDGSVELSSIASIRRGYSDDDSLVRYQGLPAVALMVSTSQKDNLLRVSEAVESVLVDIRPSLPVGVTLDVMADMSPYISEQLGLLGENALQGLLIVVVLLGLFLELRLAFWVALGIPIAMAGAVWMMGYPAFDYSINDITLFGLILVLGILVDDAVVVGESIHSARERIKDPVEAAWQGVESVTVATTFGVLTTIAAFSPMLWIENELAKVLAGFSAVVIFALLFSLVESKWILPSHLSAISTDKSNADKLRWFGALQRCCREGLKQFSERVYQPLLEAALHHRAATLIIFSAFFLLAYGSVTTGQIRTAFFPEIPGRYAEVAVTMDQDAPLALTRSNGLQLDRALQTINRDLQQRFNLEQPPVNAELLAVESASTIEMTAELTTEALRVLPAQHFINAWQQEAGNLEGAYAVSFSSSDELAGGTAITIAAPDRTLARQVSKELKVRLRTMPGVNDVYDDGQGGQRQVTLLLNERGRQLGLTQRNLAWLVGGDFGEFEVHRLLDAGEEIKVLVRYPESLRRSLEQLRSTPVFLPGGDYVVLDEVADIAFAREPEQIYRRNRDEVVTLYWRQDRKRLSPEALWAELQDDVTELERQFPGVSINAVGEFEEITEVQTGFKKALLLTLLLIYMLLAIPLKSYKQPFIIMSVIPFGFAGAILGHGLMDLPVSILSLFGMMAMTGVVVNDSLVLMTAFNHLHREGMPLKSALLTVGRQRMRAIFLTTVTTVCGLLPLLMESSEQAQYLKPAAVSLVFGELFATPITLILIPVLLSFKRERAKAASLSVNTA